MAQICTWQGDAGGGDYNWNTANNWHGSVTDHLVPVAGDDVILNNAVNCAIDDITANLKSFVMTGYTGTLSGGLTISLRVIPTSGTNSVVLAGTYNFLGTVVLEPVGATTVINFTSGGKTVGSIGIYLGTGTGTVNFQDAVTVSSASGDLLYGTIRGYGGTYNTNGFTITCAFLSTSYNGSGNASWNITNSTITCSNATTAWNATNCAVLTTAGSTINITGAGTFIGGGKSYNTVTFSGNGSTISGNNTFTTLNVNTAGLATGLKVTADSIQTVTNFATNGYASNLAKILSSSAGSHFHLSKAGGGQVSVDYMSIKDSVADQANTWYAGTHSTDVSGNSGWVFTAPPATIALTGTATASITEADIVTGGKTIILTVTNDTWVADDGTFAAQRQNIINGIDSAQSEAAGWDAEVKAKQVVGGVVRTSGTVVTITLDAQAAYNITETETITATIPATALVGNAQVVAAPTFTVSATAANLATLKTWGPVAKAAIKTIDDKPIAELKTWGTVA